MIETELTITRIFNAPREVVWKAWTDPKMYKQWWGPEGFSTPIIKIDLKVGGENFNCMQAPDGEKYCSKGTYKEIKPQEMLVVTDSFVDEDGNIVPATYYGLSEGFPIEMQVTVTLEEQDGKTKLTLRHSDVSKIFESELNDMRQGWNESFDKLEKYLAKI